MLRSTQRVRVWCFCFISLCCYAVTAHSHDDLVGAWDSDFGWVVLRTGPAGSIVGHWMQSPTQRGRITHGEFAPGSRSLKVNIAQPWDGEKGEAKFTLSEDGSKLYGTWKHSKGSGQWKMTRVRGRRLEAQIDSILANHGVTESLPGVALLVVQDSEPVVQRCLGLADVKTGRALTASTPVELASVSKLITAQAVMIAQDHKLLNVSDEVRRYVPELPIYNPKRPITIKHLLDHTSGLPDYLAFPYPNGRDQRFVTVEDYATAFAQQKDKFPLLFPTGGKYQYGNVNYMLLALIVQRASKESFGKFVKDEIFDPLKMSTAFAYEHPDAVPLNPKRGYQGAIAYCEKEGSYVPNRVMPPQGNEKVLTVGDGYLFASLDDMAKWDASWQKGRLVTLETLKAACSEMKTDDGQGATHGYTVGPKGRLKTISHYGGNAGTRTCYLYDVETGRSVILLGNRGDLPIKSIATSVERLFWERQYKE